MTAIGIIIYLAAVGLAFMIWRAVAGASIDELFDRGEDEHHHVQRVIAKHPHGGSWREHVEWMRDAEKD